MNVNIYLDQQTEINLNHYLSVHHETRSKVIRNALQVYLAEESRGWPQEVLNFTGVPDTKPFESYRTELNPPKAMSFK